MNCFWIWKFIWVFIVFPTIVQCWVENSFLKELMFNDFQYWKWYYNWKAFDNLLKESVLPTDDECMVNRKKRVKMIGSCFRIVQCGWMDGEWRLMEWLWIYRPGLHLRSTSDVEDGPGRCYTGLDLLSQLGELQPSHWIHGEEVAALGLLSNRRTPLQSVLTDRYFGFPIPCTIALPYEGLCRRRMNVEGWMCEWIK